MERYLPLKLCSKKSVLEALVLLFVFSVPLIGATPNFGYEQIKVLFFILSISLIGLLWMGKELKWTPVIVAAGLFILILLVTSAVGVDPKTSILGNQPYSEGWVVYAYLLLFALIVSSLEIRLKNYALVLAASSLIVSLLAIEDWLLKNFFGFLVPDYAGRVVSTFGQPNFYAGFLLLTLPFSYLLFKNSARISQGHSLSTQGVTLNKLSYFGMISGLISVIGIFVSYSRTAILLALLLLILGLLDQFKLRLKIGLVVLVVLASSIFLAFKFSSGIVGNEVSQPFLTKNPDLTRESVEKRVYIWPQAFTIALQKPVLGYGLENIDKSFVDYFKQNQHAIFEENLQISPVLISLKELNIDRSHNYLLDLLLFSGGAGLLAWLTLVSLLFWKLKQKTVGRQKGVLLIGLLTYLIWIQFQNQSIVHLIYFWLLVGLTDRAQG